MTKPVLYIIVPCYNEEKVIQITSRIYASKLISLIDGENISSNSKIVFVDDGSIDDTWKYINQLVDEDSHYLGLKLSRNFGHQHALMAGLFETDGLCDVTITMDCDGQDDINAIDLMLQEYESGADIVYGVRSNRDTDSFWKKNTALAYYKLLNGLGVKSIYNHADYRLISSKVIKVLKEFKEVNVYLRGMLPLVGYKSTCVYYERKERLAGKTHYSLSKMIHLAMEGITSLSIRPIRLITSWGALISAIAFALIIYALFSYFTGNVVDGWASSMIATCFIGGIQLLSLGIIGEYIGKIYLETKSRPLYIVELNRLEEKNDQL